LCGRAISSLAPSLQQVDTGLEVLFSQDFRRRHKCTLQSIEDGCEQRMQGDNRLATPDVSLQETSHRNRAGQIVADFIESFVLVLRQLKRESSDEARELVALCGQGTCWLACLPSALRDEEAELECKQFVKGQSLAASGGHGQIVGKMRLAYCFVETCQSVTPNDVLWQILNNVPATEFQGRCDPLAHRAGR
jgi:hypothetical protein